MPESQSRELLERVIEGWVVDPEMAVEYAEEVDGRWAVRMAQESRDFTTIWFSPNERTLRYEAYVLPTPPQHIEEIYRQCLFRNQHAWRAHFSIRPDGGVYLDGRIANEAVTETELGFVVAEIYQWVEVSFRSLLRVGFGR